jgi:3-oxoadipate enol-lactonase
MRSISEVIVARWFTEAFRRDHPDVVMRIRAALEATPAQGYAATCAAIRDADFRAALGKIRNKILVVAGTHDQACPAKDGKFIAEQVPDAQYVEFDASHLSNIERPASFNDAVESFLLS